MKCQILTIYLGSDLIVPGHLLVIRDILACNIQHVGHVYISDNKLRASRRPAILVKVIDQLNTTRKTLGGYYGVVDLIYTEPDIAKSRSSYFKHRIAPVIRTTVYL